MAELNRLHFNEEASVYDSKHDKFNERVAKEIRARLDWIGVDWVSDDDDDDDDDDDYGDGENDKSNRDPSRPKKEVRLLDYACGTGGMSRALAPYTTQCIGIDISEKMVEVYNSRAENQGLSHDEMHAIVGDLLATTGELGSSAESHSPSLRVVEGAPSPRLFGFDVAAVGGGLHHLADPELASDRLVQRLRPGGVLLVWDFLLHGPLGDRDRDRDHGVLHHGLAEDRVRALFEHAGAGKGFDLVVVGSGVTRGRRCKHGHHHDHGGHGDGHGDGGDDNEENGDGEEEVLVRRQLFLARGEKY